MKTFETRFAGRSEKAQPVENTDGAWERWRDRAILGAGLAGVAGLAFVTAALGSAAVYGGFIAPFLGGCSLNAIGTSILGGLAYGSYKLSAPVGNAADNALHRLRLRA